MGLNFGQQVNLAAGTFPANGLTLGVTVPVVNPRGKPTFARQIVVKNLSATNTLQVFFPGQSAAISGSGSVPDIGSTVPVGSSQIYEGAIWNLNLKGTSGQGYEVTATVAG